MLGPTRKGLVLFSLYAVGKRHEIICYWPLPQPRSIEDGVTIPSGHIECQEGALSAGTSERVKVVPTMLDIVKWILITVPPKRGSIKTRAALKQRTVKVARCVAAGSDPSADEVDNAEYLIRMHACIGDRQNPTPGFSPDQDPPRSKLCASSERGHGRPDVVQRPLATPRFTSAPALGKCHNPASVVQEICETDIEKGFRKQRRIGADSRRAMVEHCQREWARSIGSEDHHLEIDRLTKSVFTKAAWLTVVLPA